MSVSREVVIDAFTKYLGRNPESEQTTLSHMTLENEDALIKALTTSKEFLGKTIADIDFDEGARYKFLMLGNCQLSTISKLIQAMSSSSSAIAIELTPRNLHGIQSGNLDLTKLIQKSDYIVLQHIDSEPFRIRLNELYPACVTKIIAIPGISFSAFHPDMGYIKRGNGTHLSGPMGEYHSMIAFWAWTRNRTIFDTVNLFTHEVYNYLGYFDHKHSSEQFLQERGLHTGFPIDALLARWMSTGCFMHSLNHPKLFVLADLARAILDREKISYHPDVENYVVDELADHPCWPVYPEIGNQLVVNGHYTFKQAKYLGSPERPMPTMSLEEYVSAAFKYYSTHSHLDLNAFRVESSQFQTLQEFLDTRASAAESSQNKDARTHFNPYSKLQNYQFWRRAVELPSLQDVDPVVCSTFQLNRNHKVATAGSCFAQHISRTLANNGFTYYIEETGSSISNDKEVLKELNYGVFSSRYGNIYTARQLVQLFDRAYSLFTPTDDAWERKDGRYVDPFRPLVEPGGYSSPAEVQHARTTHLNHVRTMFENMDIFVFTLGLTEAWKRIDDGAIFPLAPGVAAGSMDSATYSFINFETHEIIKDLELFIQKLASVNSKCKLILTVSPVPLIATYEDRHVLTSTTYSKSALRSAADYIVRRYDRCEYFPSYEIITGNYTQGRYYETDLRSVREEGVAHVMRLFMKHYSADADAAPAALNVLSKVNYELMREASKNNAIVCDEEALDPGNP